MTEAEQPVSVDEKKLAELFKLSGNKLFAEGKFVEALSEYEKAISKDPTVPVYFSNAATCQSRVGNNEEALRLINEAIRIDPNFIKAYYRRGVCLMEFKRFAEASEDFIRVCQEFPADVEAQKRLRECDQEADKKSSFENSLRAGFSSAIKVKRFELTQKCLEELSVDANYSGPVIAYDTQITAEWIKETLVPHFAADKKLNIKYAYMILLRAKECFAKEESLVEISISEAESMTVCGDIHGQFFDLLEIFGKNGYPSATHKYLFNGDVVDRGSYSVECLLTLLAFKIANPTGFYISRGNHEAEHINRVHGFYDECSKKYNHQFFTFSNQVMNYMPISYLIEKQVFVVHGGLPQKPDFMLEDVKALQRVKDPETGSLLSQLLWSDPKETNGISPSHRGEGVLFGPDVTEAFLQRNELKCMIRSHVWQEEGYAIEHGGKCITIFSAPNYTGSTSFGAWIDIDSHLNFDYQKFEAAKYQGKAEKPRPSMPIRGGWY